jgi:hypothetical protein
LDPEFPVNCEAFLLLVTADVPTGLFVDQVRLTVHPVPPVGMVQDGDEEVRVPVGLATHADPFHAVPDPQSLTVNCEHPVTVDTISVHENVYTPGAASTFAPPKLVLPDPLLNEPIQEL